MAAFCFIASGVMAMHYETVLKQFGQSFTPIAVGSNNVGKTTSAKAFLSLVGREETGIARQLMEAEASLKCPSTVPFVFDDPDNLADCEVLINNNFNGQVCANINMLNIPKTTCLFTINEEKLSIIGKDSKT